ncbi:ABC transporter ATP-binding protein [Alicycliphilus denitrificans]|jgi:branched-chain amino acid transport system ATP-binding protein|uniref:ABC transporter ATP-binding protein n=1 Tax=Alicycliphilus denitrificans TaxID=179636 RepID=UPI00095D5593|nr:ABC transporter ATP-binding protein [Alicycliphilus denitrificans]MBN9576003.1 ABC transporter ATP-binding protein [Alicycliphilus denitrificans]OJW89094.1 MAG: ABC transporter ATP-binding protein [Alicycliphilus sp. 69-12]BCN40875.1 ABC transporter ATP-binding protein [Alicycliphilus denitrificans]
MNSNAAILQARGVFKNYGDIRVLHDVALEVAPGTTHAVIGPNGAGKTTLFKVLSGELFATAGTVHFEGRDVSRVPGHARVRRGMGRTFQVARVFGENTVLDNMAVAIESREAAKGSHPLRSLSVSRSSALLEECRSILAQVGLGGRLHERAGVLAYGERKRLELAMTLALKPRMLLLDEPMAGMSPGDRIAAVELLRRISLELSMSILLTEHDMSVVFALADRVTVLNYGKVIASGSPEEVKASPLVREVYLGH